MYKYSESRLNNITNISNHVNFKKFIVLAPIKTGLCFPLHKGKTSFRIDQNVDIVLPSRTT